MEKAYFLRLLAFVNELVSSAEQKALALSRKGAAFLTLGVTQLADRSAT